jgi:hypothetical protein
MEFNIMLYLFSMLLHLPMVLEIKLRRILLRQLWKASIWQMRKGQEPRLFLYTVRFRNRTEILESLLVDSINSCVGEKMAIVAERIGTPTVYVPKSERGLPESEQTTFIFKKVRRAKTAAKRDGQVAFSETGAVKGFRQATTSHALTVERLSGWTNFLSPEDGSQMVFDAAHPAAMFDLIPEHIQEELERFVMGLEDQSLSPTEKAQAAEDAEEEANEEVEEEL